MRPSLSARARAALVTTPGKLRLVSVVVAAVLVAMWVVDLAVVNHRQSGVTGFANGSNLVVVAQRIQTELTDADAGAANAFLAGGLEPADQVARYVNGTKAAADDMALAAVDAGTTGPAGAQVKVLSEDLATYTGLVQTAQADNRQGFPIGAAYLRSASQLLHGTVIPAAIALAQLGATRDNHAADRATGVTDVVVVVLMLVLLLACLGAAQLYLTRRTRRALNLGLVAATLIGLILAFVVLGRLGSERADVVSGGEHDYASVARLTAARVLAFQAQGDESAALIARGNGGSDENDLDGAAARVKILLAQAAVTATAADTSALSPTFSAWQAVDGKVRSLDASGQHDQAVALALGHTSGDSLPSFDAFDAQLGAAIAAEDQSLVAQTSKAHRALHPLAVVAFIGVLLAIVATLAGVQPRVNEYR